METILVNKLPTRTWNRLGVNETALLWDEAGAVDGGTEVLSADGRLELSADAPYARRTVEITAARGQRVTVYEMFRGGDHLHVRTVLRPERGAVIRLVQVQVMDEHAVLRSEVSAHCPEGSSVELYRLLPGRGDTYADDRLTLYNLRFTEAFPLPGGIIAIGISFNEFVRAIAEQRIDRKSVV